MKKKVSDEDFVKAFGQLDTPIEKMTKEQRDNHKLMRSITNKYSNILNEEEIYSCMMRATLRCLEHHENDKGNKFTTSLYRFIKWECNRELAKKFKETNNQFVSINEFDNFDCQAEEESDDISSLRECISLLSITDQELIKDYYFDRYTMEEIGKKHNYTKEAARQKINKALVKLKELYISQA